MIREIKIKTILRFPLIPVKMTKINKTNENPSAGPDPMAKAHVPMASATTTNKYEMER